MIHYVEKNNFFPTICSKQVVGQLVRAAKIVTRINLGKTHSITFGTVTGGMDPTNFSVK